MPRPSSDEYANFYAGYVDLVPENDVIPLLRTQLKGALMILDSVPDDRWHWAYAPGKWTIAQLVGHLVDTEWVFASRALWIARNGPADMPGMDQDEFVSAANFSEQSAAQLIDQLTSLRNATSSLFESFGEEQLARTGVASDCRVSVRAIGFILVGHLRHHLRVLRESYLEA